MGKVTDIRPRHLDANNVDLVSSLVIVVLLTICRFANCPLVRTYLYVGFLNQYICQSTCN